MPEDINAGEGRDRKFALTFDPEQISFFLPDSEEGPRVGFVRTENGELTHIHF